MTSACRPESASPGRIGARLRRGLVSASPLGDPRAAPCGSLCGVTPCWEHFEHRADIGVRGVAPTLAGALEQAALAMTAVITDPAGVRPDEAVEIRCEAADDETLLVAWLNAVVYEMAVRRMLFGRFAVRLDGRRLHAVAHGEPVDVARHRPAVEVKGATFTALRVACGADGAWTAQTVVDV